MKQIYLWMLLLVSATTFAQQPIITTIVDGDCSGGNPKLLEIYAQGAVDFSNYSLENETNSNTSFGNSFSLSGLGTVIDDFVYITTSGSATALASEFPSLSNANIVTTGTMSVNGDDRLRIVDAQMNVVDQFGVSGVRGTGESWEYSDSFAKRIDGTGPDAGFNEANWTFGGAGVLDGLGTCQSGAQTYETLIGGVGTYSTTANTNPTINVSGPVTGLDYFETQGPSDEGTLSVSGRNLTADIVITVPSTDFEISETSGGTFSQSITLQQQAGDVAATTIYVRLAGGLQSATYTEDITFVSGGATTQTVTVAGQVSPNDPDVFISGNADGLTYNEGNGPSSEDAFAIGGRFLTDANVVVSVPAPFEISLTTGGTFSQTVNVPVDGNGEVDFVDVFIRLAAGQTAGQYSEDVSASANGDTATLTVTGEVFPAANCPNVGNLIITEIMQNPSAVGDSDGEYFEVYNTSSASIDLQSFILKDSSSTSEEHTIASSVIVPANGYVVLGNNADFASNGGVNVDYEYSGNYFLGNGTDDIVLECGGTTIDQVEWDNGATFPDPNGASMELAQSVVTGPNAAALNDDGANWGTATSAYGDGDLGTPGAANDFTLSNDSFDNVSFKLYPNPVSGSTVNIETAHNESVNVSVYSLLGKQVLNVKDVSRTFNVSALDAGVYLVTITQGEQSQTRKLIVK
ncbi:hypothetical protein BST97_11865 [Nonlabens spongiae]|uniref:LTD domain-containing protein n=1 Tax=Nonlabens spongiae TaxID=331648 RepID=A0A1W6MM04_9FLAO|nr:lamin tail domain-containing protein [Nonlabens spongiae]ARN78628.1 hypothetical protein BST97_11865 [Nonlabens spongiae]